MVARGMKTARGKKVAVREPLISEDKGLRDYEMVLVISPELDEGKFNSILDDISKNVTDAGGVMSDIKRWGKRKLAYPIKHFSEGNYALAQFQLKPEAGKEIEAKLQISEDVLRHLLVRLDS